MRLIINSYLKTFVKHWASALGVLLFIIMLGAIVLGMMSTPLQMNNKILRIKAQSETYNYRIQDKNKYSQDFDYHYFVLNGHKYTNNIEDQPSLLNQLDGYEPIKPEDLNQLLINLRTGADGFTFPQTIFSPSLYLALDQILTEELNNSSWNWADLLAKYDNEKLINSSDISLATETLSQLQNKVNSFLAVAQSSANIPVVINLKPNKAMNYLDHIVDIFVNDLETNVKADKWITIEEDAALTETRTLFIINEFLKANGVAPLETGPIDYDALKIAIKNSPNVKNSHSLALTGIMILQANFRSLLWSNYQNNISYFVLSQTINNPKNQWANFDHQPRYALDNSVEFGLARNLPGAWTPDFSTDMRSIETSSPFNKPILERGEKPTWNSQGSINTGGEIVVNESFLKGNKIKLGDKLKLPPSPFGTNVSVIDREAFRVGNELSMTIVGTALKYDELTPGPNFTSFVQPFKNYTYSYLPGNYLETYIHASYVYSTAIPKGGTNIGLRVKTLQGKSNLPRVLELNPAKGESVYEDSTVAIVPFSKVLTISKLNMIKIQVVIYTILGLVSLVLAFIFINFVIKKEINETRRQLGIFKSFGYTTPELSLIFAIKTLITISIGIIFGWLCSFPLQVYMASNFLNSVMFTYQKIYFGWGLILVIFIGVPALFMLVSYLITIRYLRQPALALINNMASKSLKSPHIGPISKALKRHDKGFEYRLSQSFVKASKGKFVVVQILFAFSALIYTLMFGAQAIMYQAIEQGFSLIKKDTDHQYLWQNKNSLTIDESSDNKFTLNDIEDYEENKINYIDYSDYATVNEAMTTNPDLQTYFSDSRFRFRVLTDALSNSIAKSEGIDNWVLMPKDVAIDIIQGNKINIANVFDPQNQYFVYRLLTFKALNEPLDNKFAPIIQEMVANNSGYKGNYQDFLTSFGKGADAWLNISDLINTEKRKASLALTFFGLTAQTKGATPQESLANNILLTDLSRIFSMFFANQYILEQLRGLLGLANGNIDPNISEDEITTALTQIYENAKKPDNPLYGYDPRDSSYWNMQNNPLINTFSRLPNTEDNKPKNEGIIDVIGDMNATLLGILTAGMLSKSTEKLLDEPVLNFNNFFFNKTKENLQLLLNVIPQNSDIGATQIDLVDAQKTRFGDVRRQYNFDGVTASQYEKLTIKPEGKNTFNGIIPYAIARQFNVEIGDKLTFYTNTSVREEINIIVVGINRSITIPISTYWLIFVDYNLFADNMFSNDFKKAINFNDNSVLSQYFFNTIISEESMLHGTFDIKAIGQSLNSFSFGGNQLVMNVKPSTNVFGPLIKQLATLLGVDENKQNARSQDSLIDVNLNDAIEIDNKMNLVTNPMMMNIDTQKMVAFPFNIARNGFANFATTMGDLMTIFLLLQSLLLTIILCVVMNIIVDEASTIILTLRAIGYSQKEINWIIMGPYVVGIIISFILAYAFSNIIWKVFLIVAAEQWDIIVFFPFDWKGLVIPILVLGLIMFIGWLASNYQVNRRPLTQITNLV
ncbi:FtsX-like permease family protein [Entomoplasma freundtii]|uniref:ABC transporter permease n=1 Tax=Entomoplasma freundtii TaxID=74700 RepID=A0A2K8NRN8_9MOLU|nr:ABC transporter permease [Entomoplasma freundtii]ATZ16522.1 ABC transporter permease [Entomoplasma freundtii]TDY56052.1 FtsX-like permease family protein [Entomoplasma freundtii]